MGRGPFIRTSKNATTLSRRTFLRGALGGAAVTLALPTFEAMVNSDGTALADGSQFPQRFVLWYWGNGVVTNRWIPTGTGTNYQLSDALSSFANVKDYLSVISGTALRGNSWAHYSGAGLLLTGENPDGLGTIIGGPARRATFDQTIANAIAGTTPFKSLQVGIAYYSHGGANSNLMIDSVSHSGAGTALRAEQDPAAVFNRLFGGNFMPSSSSTPVAPSSRDIARSQVLDAVKAEADRLKQRLGQRDRERLEAHLSAIADLQKRLTPPARAAVGAECKKPDLAGFANYAEKCNVMNEVVRLALACDLTRVVSYMFSSPASHREYPEIGINVSFHAEVAHQETPPQAVYHSGVKFFMSRFSSLLDRLKATPEGAGNMLDNMCVLGTSCIATQTAGGQHGNDDWPLLVAGRAGGKLVPGTHYRSTSAENSTNVPLTCMKAMGLPVTEYGVGPAQTSSTVPILT